MILVKVKRIIALVLACIFLAVGLVGCANRGKTLLELEGNKISVNLFQLYLSRMKGTLCSANYFGSAATKDDFWDTVDNAYEKSTYNTKYTDMVLDTAKSYLAALALFDERGLKLPDSYIEEIDSELDSLVENVANGSKTTLNSILAEFGANYNVLRDAYIVEAKIAYLRDDIFGANGSKVGAEMIEEYYQETYARYKQVFFYTYEQLYETDKNGDNIYYTENGSISYDTSKTVKRDENGNEVFDEHGNRVYVYTDENGYERIAYKIKNATRKAVGKRDYEGEELELIIDKASSVLEQVKKDDTIGFDLLVSKYNEEDGDEQYPDGYYMTADADYAAPEVIDALFELNVGEYKMVKSEHGLHIIMRYELEDGAYALEEYEDIFVAKSTGTYIFINDLIDKRYTEYVSSYKEKVKVNEELLGGVDIKSVGINYNY